MIPPWLDAVLRQIGVIPAPAPEPAPARVKRPEPAPFRHFNDEF